jgi:hypothetical protein
MLVCHTNQSKAKHTGGALQSSTREPTQHPYLQPQLAHNTTPHGLLTRCTQVPHPNACHQALVVP